MNKLTLALLMMVLAQSAAASVWKYNSVKCDSEAITQQMSQGAPNETHLLTVNPKLKVLEFSSIIKNGKTERFYYKYEKLSDKAVKMQKVNLATGASKYQEVAEARAFSYDMSFDIDTLKLESKVKTADAVVNCTTTYDLNQ